MTEAPERIWATGLEKVDAKTMKTAAAFTLTEIKRVATVARDLGFCVVVRKDEIRMEPIAEPLKADATNPADLVDMQ